MSKKLILTPNAYKAGKVYAVKPINGTGDFDFVRNTGRTRVNVNGNIEELSNNIVALDYQNGCPEILLEPQRTNLFEYSEDFSNSYWDKTSVTIESNAELSPAGINSADKLVEDATNDLHRLSIFEDYDSQQNYTHSFFVKEAGRKYIKIKLTSFGDVFTDIQGEIIYDIENGTIISNTSQNTKASITLYKNNYYRISFSFKTGDATNNSTGLYRLKLLDNLFNESYQGDGASGIFIWGAQAEEAEKTTSYIPTNGSTVTRNQDILQKDLTNIIQPTYTAFLEVVGDEGRLKIEDNITGIDLPLTGSGKIAIQVYSQIKIIFPDNGQPQTELIYENPDDLRNIDIVSKLAATRIGVIAIEDGIQDVSNWVSGNVSSYFIETDWSAETDLEEEFRDDDWDYFPSIDLSNGTDFERAWQDNNLTSFPAIDLSNGTVFRLAWLGNNLTSFPAIDLSNGTDFFFAWRESNLTSFPANMFDNNNTDNYDRAFQINDLNQQSVDNILISVNTSAQANNITDGDLGINGGTNATPSATGQSAADALFANGWTVELNGYTPS